MAININDKDHDRIIHQLDDLRHDLEIVEDQYAKGIVPRHQLWAARAKLEGAEAIFNIANKNV
jgi:outer membrane protein TolC